MKFTITIDELIETYSNKKKSDELFLCHFIQFNLLPRRSIFHRIYLLLRKASNQFTHLVAKEFNCPPHNTLNQMMHNHPDFKDISQHLTTNHQYRLALLHRMKELKPNLTFTLNY